MTRRRSPYQLGFHVWRPAIGAGAPERRGEIVELLDQWEQRGAVEYQVISVKLEPTRLLRQVIVLEPWSFFSWHQPSR